LGEVSGLQKVELAPKLFGEIRTFRIYNRYLRTSEAVANFRNGMPMGGHN
jgi:hypothetical protein